MKKNHITKAISYAFATSKIAADMGFEKTGCYYVQQTLWNIEDSGQCKTFPAHNGEGYISPDDPDLISFFNECEGEVCKQFLKYGNAAALLAIAGT